MVVWNLFWAMSRIFVHICSSVFQHFPPEARGVQGLSHPGGWKCHVADLVGSTSNSFGDPSAAEIEELGGFCWCHGSYSFSLDTRHPTRQIWQNYEPSSHQSHDLSDLSAELNRYIKALHLIALIATFSKGMYIFCELPSWAAEMLACW